VATRVSNSIRGGSTCLSFLNLFNSIGGGSLCCPFPNFFNKLGDIHGKTLNIRLHRSMARADRLLKVPALQKTSTGAEEFFPTKMNCFLFCRTKLEKATIFD
jgi:hypothetical protein